MSNLVQSQKKLLFGWYYMWLKLSSTGEPQQDIDAGMRQPDMIKISQNQPDSNQSEETWALSISVVPNKGILGAEYSIIYMIKEFKKKSKSTWMLPPQTIPRDCIIYSGSVFKEQQQPSGLPCWTNFQLLLAPTSHSRRPRRSTSRR
eukprot:3982481-Ditylum_brightwellii.AAC.1